MALLYVAVIAVVIAAGVVMNTWLLLPKPSADQWAEDLELRLQRARQDAKERREAEDRGLAGSRPAAF